MSKFLSQPGPGAGFSARWVANAEGVRLPRTLSPDSSLTSRHRRGAALTDTRRQGSGICAVCQILFICRWESAASFPSQMNLNTKLLPASGTHPAAPPMGGRQGSCRNALPCPPAIAVSVGEWTLSKARVQGCEAHAEMHGSLSRYLSETLF